MRSFIAPRGYRRDWSPTPSKPSSWSKSGQCVRWSTPPHAPMVQRPDPRRQPRRPERPLVVQCSRWASSVTSGTPANALLTGHPVFAAKACSRKVDSSTPGTQPPLRGRSCDRWSTVDRLRVTVASVRTESGQLRLGRGCWTGPSKSTRHVPLQSTAQGLTGTSSKRDLYV